MHHAKSVLDIVVEGALLGELRGIIDELDVMLDIRSQQRKALREFQNSIQDLIARPSTVGLSKSKEVIWDDGDAKRTVYQRRTFYNTLETGLRLLASLENQVLDIRILKERAQRTERDVSYEVPVIAGEG